MLQIRLLNYAAYSREPITEEEIAQDRCAAYLEHFPEWTNKGSEIAKWIWRGAETSDSQVKMLEGFAEGPADDKKELTKKLYEDILKLMHNPKGSIYVFGASRQYKHQSEATWLRDGAKFLRNFYHNIESSRSSGFPSCIFWNKKRGNFTRQDYLDEFIKENKNLYICPVCDETGYYTSSAGNIYTDIEHFFPKDLYPHFSCHPYNLFPICHLCNSAIHSTMDPLNPMKKKAHHRLQLQDIPLPYREELGSKTFLVVDLGNGLKDATFVELKPRDEESDKEQNLSNKILTLRTVYEIPQRWNRHYRTEQVQAVSGQIDRDVLQDKEYHGIDRVGETLFRRMRQFLQGTVELPLQSTEELHMILFNGLHQLLYFLQEKERGDYGRDPLAFAMIWLLVEILEEESRTLEIRGKKGEQSYLVPLVRELSQWLGQDIKDKSIIAETANMLRVIVRQHNLTLTNIHSHLHAISDHPENI